MLAGARLVLVVMAYVIGTSRGSPCLDLSAPREPAWRGRPRGGLASSASRGLAPREGLECLLVKMGHTGPLVEPRRGPQAGKSGDPRSQNADNNDEHEYDKYNTTHSIT